MNLVIQRLLAISAIASSGLTVRSAFAQAPENPASASGGAPAAAPSSAAVTPPAAAPASAAPVDGTAQGAASAAVSAEPAPAPVEATAATGELVPAASVPASEPTGDGTLPAGDAANSRGGAPERLFHHDRESEFENGHVFVQPKEWLEFHGNMQIDTAYAAYSFSDPEVPFENLYDLRGRFVLGPTLWHKFNNGWFVRARAEFVAWLRELKNSYQINVDDAFAQAGQVGLWDVKVGRFFSWRVYHRGPGFDLFTTEDLGACRDGNCATQDVNEFAPHMYDVSNIYDRESPGRGAFHFYPTSWAGIEALVQYGSTSVENKLGGRLAAVATFPFLRVSAAFEGRQSDPTQDNTQPAEGGGFIPCPTCGSSSDLGGGGGAELTLKDIGLEVAGNGGYSERTAYTPKDNTLELGRTGKMLSVGGYGQFDIGKYVFHHGFIVGAGYNYTESVNQRREYDVHGQLAVYALMPIDVFQGAEVKLVYSNAQLNSEKEVDMVVDRNTSVSNAIRLRFSLNY